MAMAAAAGSFSLWQRQSLSRWRPPRASASDKVEFVKKAVSSHDIVIFSKSYCPFCAVVKGIFEELGKKPYIMELDESEDGSNIQDALSKVVGRHTVPQVFIHGEHLGGCDNTIEAYDDGRLLTLLGIRPKYGGDFNLASVAANGRIRCGPRSMNDEQGAGSLCLGVT